MLLGGGGGHQARTSSLTFPLLLDLRQHILAGNDLWQLINSSEYKSLSKAVLTNLHFSSSHTGNFLIILTREMFKENATNSSEIYGQCFPNRCTNLHQTVISFSSMNSLLPHRCTCSTGCPDTWASPTFSFTQPSLLILSLEKGKFSIACQHTQ